VVVRSVLYLRPVDGDCASIQRYFEREQVLQRASRTPGYLAGELQLPPEPSQPALVTALWESPAAYRAWVEDPWRAVSSARAAEVFEAVEQPGGGGALYDVTIEVPAPPGGGREGAG
jgi:heme-degrading monooxygenase HmoA